jgi:superoxide dismutase, Fe-Mn family
MSASSPNSRRNFIANSIKGSIAVGIGLSATGELLASCSNTKNMSMPSPFNTGFDQQPLPYKYADLENVIDAKTMEIHYSKHAATYSKNLKEAVAAEGVGSGESLEALLARISKYSVKMRNNGGGHYNHELFWQCMRPKSKDNKPSPGLLKKIEAAFTSFDAFKKQFGDAGKNRFGSGWAWLYVDNNKQLKVGSTPNQDNPLMDVSEIKGIPVLGLDVWEHAYYLKYQNKRADYVDSWWDLVNWDFVEARLNKIV